ncbi:hypothetical protein [Mesorhizobium sp.]|jgi:hypothetical protein|uniref:hypothetical protein n=1 Tax=Mesorhizobium sp. TaxID=1871066 RepID=UPI000FE90F7D|nr:hypothetical protein [Mesorhizobium sp.]RWP86058.1 MAG: hypothetical protein EOR11_17330 [Mesorhizobium sp.]RWQ14370.1 MAG: hypothetical protein EOR93_29740 [Mesorhizobium sp.]TIM96920.1 MAG: hypothetical protein E5Y34_21695 [Mesorhizobium sp.]TIN73265.1 MAG: hypothetical protein E5Y30_03190 [Mesorhizobium sp.]TIU41417.1 MAG: hypothetical protein E5W26_06205 [Mesorhizobium sp.]
MQQSLAAFEDMGELNISAPSRNETSARILCLHPRFVEGVQQRRDVPGVQSEQMIDRRTAE